MRVLGHPVAKPSGNLIGCGNHRFSKFWDPAQLKPLGRPGDTDGRKHLALVVSNRSPDAAHTLLMLNVVYRIPPVDNLVRITRSISCLLMNAIMALPTAVQCSGARYPII